MSAAQAAYSGVSFTPEKRAIQERESYASQMVQDYEHFRKMIQNKPELAATLETEFERYRQGYRTRLLKKLYSDSRCLSWMITGPSNFPTRRNEKRNNVAHKRLEELLEFRKRAMGAITKTLYPELRPIMSGDADAVRALEAKITEAKALHDEMHAVNKVHKEFLKDPESLKASGLSEKRQDVIRNYKPTYSWTPHPIWPYEFTNSSANIRRMEKRLEGLKRNKATPATEREGTNARLEDCPADNRIRLFFPGKPSVEVRERLKRSGFRWSPTIGCWQAYRNWSAIEAAKREAGELLPEPSTEEKMLQHQEHAVKLVEKAMEK